MDKKKKKQLFEVFLKDAPIMIVDRSPRTRSRLTRSMIELGASKVNIHSVAHFEEALEACDEHKPALILSDYVIRGGSGFDLFKAVRENYPELSETILVLITSNISQTAVAKAAEEDVDAFIIKPYTAQTFDQSLQNSTINKLYPSEYVKTIEAGKKRLFDGEFEESLRIFESALEMNKKPALAHFYHGQAKYLMEESSEAINDYNQGLEHNTIHYKCQVGLYELFAKEKLYDKAYGVVKNITKYFPANPKRLKEVIRLSIRTQNYTDMDYYYDTFLNLDERSSDVVDYVCSGMFIFGKFNLEQARDQGKALNIFEKVGISSGGEPKFLKAIIQLLCRYHLYEEGYQYLKRFPHGSRETAEYKVSALLIESHGMDLEGRLKGALEVYNDGFKEFEVFSILVKSMVEKEYMDQAEKYIQEAKELFPDREIKIKSKPIKAAA